MRQQEFELYHDAIKGRCSDLLGKVFDNVRVRVEYCMSRYTITVTAHCSHRQQSYGYRQMFDVCMLNPHDYSNYLRDQMPAEFAREIIEVIMRS